MTLRRFAAPALAVLVALGASGCAGISFNQGCGLGSVDPMTDGASRMNRSFQAHQLRAQHMAYQHKALMVGSQFSRNSVRKPGSLPLTQTPSPVSPLCVR